MFDALLAFEPEPGVPGDFVPLGKAPVQTVVDAQAATAEWLQELGVPSDEEIDTRLQTEAARDAFKQLNFEPSDAAQKNALVRVKTPEAVRHLTGMLTAYDWDFIDMAKELRGYAVAKIVDETKHPDARIRLKALDMLGKVTEVGLFTERIEVKKVDASEEELERRLKARLEKFLDPEQVFEVQAHEPEDAEDDSEDPLASDTSLDAEISRVAESRHA
jgi:hypothetical protein